MRFVIFGTLRTSGSQQFQNIRRRVYDEATRMKNDRICILSANHDSRKYVETISESKFCFVLPGDTGGGEKLALSIMQGCVPVIDHMSWRHMPFFEFLNYSKFVVRMPKTLNVKQVFENIQKANYTEYKTNLDEARKWFDYGRHDEVVSPYKIIWTKVNEMWS